MDRGKAGPPRIDPAVLAQLRDEITNPLTAIDVEAQLLLASDAVRRSPEVRDSAHRIIGHCRRIAELLRKPRVERESA